MDVSQIPVSEIRTSGALNIRMDIACQKYFLDGRIAILSMIKYMWVEGDNCTCLFSPEQFYTSLHGVMSFVWDLGDSTVVTACDFAPYRPARRIRAKLVMLEVVQLTWDPGDSEIVLDSTLISKNLAVMPATGHGAKDDTVKGGMPVIWDPGGLPHCRLEDKPKFKGEGLSATLPNLWTTGRHSWAGPAWKDMGQQVQICGQGIVERGLDGRLRPGWRSPSL